jgi:hypothetical protein
MVSALLLRLLVLLALQLTHTGTHALQGAHAMLLCRRKVNTTWRNPHVRQPSRHRALLTISGVDVGVELPRPLPPHVKYVGPLLVGPTRALPPDLEQFVAGRSLVYEARAAAPDQCPAHTHTSAACPVTPQRAQHRCPDVWCS